MDRYPRSRKETTDPPTIDEIAEALRKHWDLEAKDIQQAVSRRVHYVDLSEREVMFRANPGWDGPTPPSLIVKYVDHLSRMGAPAPEIIPTQSGDLSALFRDHTISVESRLPGEDLRHREGDFLPEVGKPLVNLHLAARTFPDRSEQMLPAGECISTLFERSFSRWLKDDEKQAAKDVQNQIIDRYSEFLEAKVPWIMCRGDVIAQNALATEAGEVSFADFDATEFAPTIYDLIIGRLKWMESLSPTTAFLLGYQQRRPLQNSEIVAFPAISAAYYVNQRTFMVDRRRHQNDLRLPRARERALKLPVQAIFLAEELLKCCGLV